MASPLEPDLNGSSSPNGLRVHTPDPTRYHKLPESPGYTTIARADAHGRPLGFQHDKPGDIVVVYGDKSKHTATQVVVPLSRLAAAGTAKDATHQALSQSSSPFDTFQKLAEMTPKGGSAAAKAGGDDPPHVAPVPTTPAPIRYAALPVSAPVVPGPMRYAVPPVYAPAPSFVPPEPTPPDAVMQALRLLTEQMQLLVAAQRPAVAAPDVSRPWEEERVARRDRGDLGLEFVGIDQAKRPEEEVSVDLGAAGKMRTWYHKVVVTSRLVLLVFDNRYEGSTVWEPQEDPGRIFTVEVPSQQVRARCLYLGMRCMLGSLILTVLLRDEEGE